MLSLALPTIVPALLLVVATEFGAADVLQAKTDDQDFGAPIPGVVIPAPVMDHVGQEEVAAAEKKVEFCQLCHKPDLQNPAPTLEGQPSRYLFDQLRAYKEGRRDNFVMQTNVSGLSEKDMRDIADYYASRRPQRGKYPVDAVKVSRGKEIAAALNCARCHYSNYLSRDDAPRLAGMKPGYLGFQIVRFTTGQRYHPAINRDNALNFEDAMALGQYFAQIEW